MLSAYAIKRREPRVALRTRISLTLSALNKSLTVLETTTTDVSPHGASVNLPTRLEPGTVVGFEAKSYAFVTRAVVRSVAPDPFDGGYSIGLEYLDQSTNPLVVWLDDTRNVPPTPHTA